MITGMSNASAIEYRYVFCDDAKYCLQWYLTANVCILLYADLDQPIDHRYGSLKYYIVVFLYACAGCG